MKDIRVTDLPPEKMRNVLRTKDDHAKVEFAGKEREFFIGGITYDFAEEEEIDLAEVFEVLEGAESLDEDDMSSSEGDQILMAMTWLLYLGMRPFTDDISPAEVKLHLSGVTEEEMMSLMAEIGLSAEGDDTVGKAPEDPTETEPAEAVPA